MDKHPQQLLSETYKSISDSFANLAKRQTEALNQTVGEWATQLAKRAQEQLVQICRTMGDSIQVMLDRAEVDANKVAPLLEQANFWLPPSMGLDLLHTLKTISESQDATPERMVSAFIEYYEDDEWSE